MRRHRPTSRAPLSRFAGDRLVQNDAFQRIAVVLPRLAFQHTQGIRIASLPAAAETPWAEVDILRVVLVVQPGSEQPDHMHPRQAAVCAQFLDARVIALLFRKEPHQLRYHATQLMNLTLPCNVACDAARILDLLVTMQDLPN